MGKQKSNSPSKRDIKREMRRAEKEEKKHEKKLRYERGKEIFSVGYLIVGIFCVMILYFLIFEIDGKNAVLVNPSNNRTQNMEQAVRKGQILTSDGVVVATTQNMEDGTEYRYYPFGNMFAHTLGYATKGGAGLEAKQKIKLLTAHVSFLEQIKTEFMNQKLTGDTMIVTLNYLLQSYCYEQLGGRNGAIVVMEPKTGKILAMVSCPDFNPSTIDEQWNYLISEENTSGNLLNRASQGYYAPGSTFKVITLLEYIRENPNTWQDFTYTCTGFYTDGENIINCHDGHAHGELDIYGALSQSCNGAFITMGLTLNPTKWQKLCNDFGYNQSYAMDVEYKKSQFSLDAEATDWDLMQSSIGQGTIVTTPLLNTMITSAIANDGVMMKPYLIDRFVSADSSYEKLEESEILQKCISAAEADLLTEFMVGVVRDGSGYRAGTSYAQVAGKTGSAQFSSQAGRYHAWFTGFAPADDPKLAVTVLIEDGGSGGEVAAPIAGNIFNYYFSVVETVQ